MCHFIVVFFSPFSIAITSLGEERANLSGFRRFVRFVLVWICRFPLPLGVWEGLQFVIVALPGLFSYLFLAGCGSALTPPSPPPSAPPPPPPHTRGLLYWPFWVVVPVLALLFVDLCFMLQGDLFYVFLCFFSPFSIAITWLGEERANLSAFRTFVRFLLLWICQFPFPLGVLEGLRFVIVALPGLFSYLFTDTRESLRFF